MLAYLTGDKPDDVIAASLIRLLQNYPDASKWGPLFKAASSPSPLVRAAVAETLGALPSKEAIDILIAATADDVRLVRVRAASSLSGVPRSMLALSEADDRVLQKATREYLDFLQARPDLWVSQYNLGNYYFGQGDLQKALVYYQAASRLDRSSVPPLINAAMVYAKRGDEAKAETTLKTALTNDPNNAAANFNMGLLKAGAGDAVEAEKFFRVALRTDPNMAEAAYNLGVLLAQHRRDDAVDFCRRAAQLRPDEPKYGYTLAYFLERAGDRQSAVQVLTDLLQRHPGYRDARGLLDQIRGSQR
jgi:tetratricopeptide (TPR) repeat protein